MNKTKKYYESLMPKNHGSSDRDWINTINPVALGVNHKTLEDVKELIISQCINKKYYGDLVVTEFDEKTFNSELEKLKL